jgi:hypothetical protein
LPEVWVEGKGCGDCQETHGFETGAIYQAEISTIGCQQSAYCLAMDGFIDPGYFNDWKNIVLKESHRLWSSGVAEATSQPVRNCCNQNRVLHQKDLPTRLQRCKLVIGVQYG